MASKNKSMQHEFRSNWIDRKGPWGEAGYMCGCTCGWDPHKLLFGTQEAGRRVWLEEHMKEEHICKEWRLDGSGWSTTCSCGWRANSYFPTWEEAVADYQAVHLSKLRAKQEQAAAAAKAAEKRAKDRERAEIQRRVNEIKDRFRKKV